MHAILYLISDSFLLIIGHFKLVKHSFFRKTNGKKYAEGISTIKEAVFPFPAETGANDEVDNAAVEAGVGRAQEGITPDLQGRLHESNTQLELANRECVRQGQEIDSLARGKEESQERIRNLERQNAAMRRRLEDLETGGKLPRPGPSLKPFEELTPRQQKVASSKLQQQLCQTSEERRIQPTKLSAYLTCRFASIYCIVNSIFIFISFLDIFILVSFKLYIFRSSYLQSKKVAATAKKIYLGEEVTAVKSISKELALWLITLGEGFGRRQYRY